MAADVHDEDDCDYKYFHDHENLADGTDEDLSENVMYGVIILIVLAFCCICCCVGYMAIKNLIDEPKENQFQDS